MRSARCLAFLVPLLVAACTSVARPTELSAAELLRDADELFRQRDYAEARRTYEAAARVAEREGDPLVHTQAASEVAAVRALEGAFDAGRPWLERAGRTADPAAARGWTRYLMARALYERQAGELERAHATYREAYEAALAAARERGDARWLAALWTGLGWLYEDLGRYEDALDAFRTAQNFVRREGDERAVLRADWTVAHALRMAGRTEEARDLAERALAVATRRYETTRGANDAEWVAHCQRELAELEALEGRWTVALSLLLLARERFVESGIEELAPKSLERLDQRIVEVRACAREAATERQR